MDEKGTTRASLFNLILIGNKKDRSEYLLKLSEKIIEKFPSRILTILFDDAAAPDYLSTTTSTLKSKYSVCDHIKVIVGSSAEKIVPFLTLSNLLSDLPVYLVWSQDICAEHPALAPLKKLAGRLILDSELTCDLSCFARSALAHYASDPIDIADLSWARLESWRDLLTSTFFSKEALSHLQKTAAISITYTPNTPIQALYLQSWLASRLGWQLKSHDNETFHYLNGDTPLTITLTPEFHDNLSQGTITAMILQTHDGIVYNLKRDCSAPHQISLEVTTPTQCYLPSQFVFSSGYAGGSLVKEVSHKGTSEHYLGALQLLATLKEIACHE